MRTLIKAALFAFVLAFAIAAASDPVVVGVAVTPVDPPCQFAPCVPGFVPGVLVGVDHARFKAARYEVALTLQAANGTVNTYRVVIDPQDKTQLHQSGWAWSWVGNTGRYTKYSVSVTPVFFGSVIADTSE